MEAIASRLWTRTREGSCTRATSHGTSRGNHLFPRPRQSDWECPIYHPVPKRRITCTSSRYMSLLPRLPPLLRPLQLPSHRCLHQSSPHQHKSPIALFGNWGMGRTCATRGETRAMRNSHHGMSLMSHTALVQPLATRDAFDEAFREHDLPKAENDLPTAPASDIPTPSTNAEAEASEHTEIWRGSRAWEFRGLLQAHTFGSA